MTRPACRLMETRLCPSSQPCPDDACARFQSDDPGPWSPQPFDDAPAVALKLRPVEPPPEAA